MIKFIHKKHIQENKENNKIVIYYNVSDIFLGTILLILVVFFINDYLSHALEQPKSNSSIYTNQVGINQFGPISPLIKP